MSCFIKKVNSLVAFSSLSLLAACASAPVSPTTQRACPQAYAHKIGLSNSMSSKDVVKQKIEYAKSKVFPALVTIYAYPEIFRNGRKVKSGGVGSGTIMSEDGYVITNAHVTQSAEKFICKLSNKEEVTATMVGEDYPTDLAVIKLDLTSVKDFSLVPTAHFGQSSVMKSGDMVLAMGSPSGLTSTLTMGVISNPERKMGEGAGEGLQRLGRYRTGQFTNWIQHDASINPGNSGGPLVNLQGEIVGINELKGGGDDIGYAIPSDIAASIYHELVRHGRVIRSYLGFNCGTIKDTGEEKGILVVNVDEDSPAGKAGLQAGDFILGYNGTPVSANYVEDLAPFYRMASQIPIGKKINVLVKRNGETKKITFTSVEQEQDWSNEKEFRQWGMTAAEITPLLQKDHLLESRAGVFITGVRGPAKQIFPSIANCVLTKIENTPIKNLDDLTRVYKQHAKKDKKYNLVFHYTNGVSSFVGVLEKKNQKDPQTKDTKRAWIGVDTQVFTTDIRRALGIKKKIQGVRVTNIFPNTIAEKSDLEIGDVITHIAGKQVKANKKSQTQVFPTLIQRHEVGETVALTVRRGEKLEKTKVNIELEVAPLESQYAKKTFDKDFEFGVREITFYDIVRNRWDKDIKGVIVKTVDNHGWASGKIYPGGLIQSIDSRSVDSMEQFKEIMKKIKEEQKERVKFLIKYRNVTRVAFIEPEWTE